MFVEVVFFTMLGLILGSFANVLILREETGETILGRSHCPNCMRTLEWYELFPVLSFLLLRGKCRTCAAGISWQYPLVELLMAVSLLIIGLSTASLAHRLVSIPIILILIAIAVYDFRTTYIPDRWAYLFALLAFVSGVLFSGGAAEPLRFLVAGPVAALPLFALWLASGGRWMGLGDAKLVIGFGWLLGMLGGFLALGLAFVLGAVVGLILIGITRFALTDAGFTMKSEVPFGPFLIIALCIVWFSQLYAFDLPLFLAGFLSLS
jgi:prepilin signal peptidase PulO-like enzyme (type II secretory pathway)